MVRFCILKIFKCDLNFPINFIHVAHGGKSGSFLGTTGTQIAWFIKLFWIQTFKKSKISAKRAPGVLLTIHYMPMHYLIIKDLFMFSLTFKCHKLQQGRDNPKRGKFIYYRKGLNAIEHTYTFIFLIKYINTLDPKWTNNRPYYKHILNINSGIQFNNKQYIFC